MSWGRIASLFGQIFGLQVSRSALWRMMKRFGRHVEPSDTYADTRLEMTVNDPGNEAAATHATRHDVTFENLSALISPL